MLGLSITAIGLRPLSDCLEIFRTLQPELGLEFLELAIGAPCSVDFAYPDVPLLLHDHCLYDRGLRRRLDPLRPKTWKAYADFIANHQVLAISLHPPLQRACDRQTLEQALAQMQAFLNIPVYLEVMPSPEYWCSGFDTLIDQPLLLDVSHVLIWHQGDEMATEQACDRLLQTRQVGAIHLSHNDGYRDRHDLIPPTMWFTERLPQWQRDYWVTYESLPIAHQQFQRLDRGPSRMGETPSCPRLSSNSWRNTL